jgi:hypothetical protein
MTPTRLALALSGLRGQRVTDYTTAPRWPPLWRLDPFSKLFSLLLSLSRKLNLALTRRLLVLLRAQAVVAEIRWQMVVLDGHLNVLKLDPLAAVAACLGA